MTFAYPALLWLLLLVPLAVWALRAAGARRAARARAYADAHLLGAVLRGGNVRRARWPLGLQLAALSLLLFAAAGPVARPPLPVNKAAVMIALDASRSMLADDVKPSRLEAAREVARSFVRLAPASTHIGLLTFSDGASLLVAPTTDRARVLDALARIKPADATSFAGALVGGVRALPGRAGAVPPPELGGTPAPGGGAPNAAPPAATNPDTLAPGAILMLSDGISNRGADPRIAARFAQDQRVKLYAVALGKEGGSVSRVEGQLVFAPFDTRTMQSLTQLTGGRLLAPPNEQSLDELFRELGRVVRWESVQLDLGGPLSGLAAALLLLGGALALRWQRRVP